MSQEQLADASGVARITIARIETDKANPTLQTLERLAVALGVPVSALIEKEAG